MASDAREAVVRKDVHTEHCCRLHGCKYGDPNCSVTTDRKRQSYPCETCSWVIGEEAHEMNALVSPYIDRIKAVLAREREVSRLAHLDRDRQWVENMHALCEATGQWEYNGFCLALQVRMVALEPRDVLPKEAK